MYIITEQAYRWSLPEPTKITTTNDKSIAILVFNHIKSEYTTDKEMEVFEVDDNEFDAASLVEDSEWTYNVKLQIIDKANK